MDDSIFYDESLADQYYIETNRVRINPLQSVTGAGFNGNFSFDIDVSKDMCWIVPETKLYMQFTGLQTSTYDPAFNAANIRGICQMEAPGAYNVVNEKIVAAFASGGCMNALSKIHHEIQGAGVVQSIENVPQLNQLLRMTQDNIEEASKNPTDPFYIIKPGKVIGRNPRDTPLNVIREYDTHDYRKMSYLETITKNASVQGLLTTTNGAKTITLSSHLPLAFFQEQVKVYQSRHIIRCFIDPNYKNNLLTTMRTSKIINAANLVDQNDFRNFMYSTTEGAVPTFVSADGITAAGMVGLSVSDVWLEVTMIKVSKRPLGLKQIPLNTFNTTIVNIPQNQTSYNLTISAAPHTHKIILGFQNPTLSDPVPAITATNAEAGVTLKSGTLSIFNAVDLQDITVRYLDNAYPTTPYRLRFFMNNLTTYGRYAAAAGLAGITSIPRDMPDAFDILDQGDNVRAYNDFIEAMEYTPDDRPMTYLEWLHNPLFCFRFITTTNLASNIDVKLTFNNALGNPVNMYVLYYHKGLLTCNFNENDVDYKYNYLV